MWSEQLAGHNGAIGPLCKACRPCLFNHHFASATKRSPTEYPFSMAAKQDAHGGIRANRPKFFGAAVKRKEDPALLTGKGHFVDDLRLPGTVHAAFVRSAHAHAQIRSIDASVARALPGVHLVLTFADLPEPTE